MSNELELENNMLRLLPNLLRVLAGGGDLVRLRDDLADAGRTMIDIEAESDGRRGASMDAIGAAVNKFFDYERQHELRDRTGITSAENSVVKQALRLAAGNENNSEFWDSIRHFNTTVKEEHKNWSPYR